MLNAIQVPTFDRLFDSMFQEAARPFLVRNGNAGIYSPAIDVRETEDAIFFHCDVPGMKAEDLEVTLDKDILTIQGRREAEEEAANLYRGRRYGAFRRSFTLPEVVDTEDLSANLEHGVLSVRVGKLPKAMPRKIEIQVGAGSETPQIAGPTE